MHDMAPERSGQPMPDGLFAFGPRTREDTRSQIHRKAAVDNTHAKTCSSTCTFRGKGISSPLSSLGEEHMDPPAQRLVLGSYFGTSSTGHFISCTFLHHLRARRFPHDHELRVETQIVSRQHPAVIRLLGHNVQEANVVTAVIHQLLERC